MDNKAIIVGILLIAIGSFFFGVIDSPRIIYTTTTNMPPKWIEIPSKSWVTIGDHYFSYTWEGYMYCYGSPVVGANDSRTTGGHFYDVGEVHYCGTGMTWDGFSVVVGTTIDVADWGIYKITDMNEGYVCLTLVK
jgi:hypothetical protein